MLSCSASQRRSIDGTGRTAQCVGIDNRPAIAANLFDAERRCRADGGYNRQVRPPVRRPCRVAIGPQTKAPAARAQCHAAVCRPIARQPYVKLMRHPALWPKTDGDISRPRWWTYRLVGFRNRIAAGGFRVTKRRPPLIYAKPVFGRQRRSNRERQRNHKKHVLSGVGRNPARRYAGLFWAPAFAGERMMWGIKPQARSPAPSPSITSVSTPSRIITMLPCARLWAMGAPKRSMGSNPSNTPRSTRAVIPWQMISMSC